MDQASGLFSGSPLRGPVFRPLDLLVSLCPPPAPRAASWAFSGWTVCANWGGGGGYASIGLNSEDRLVELALKAFAP